MTFPGQTLTVIDPGLGVVTPASNTPVMSGIAHGGTTPVNTLATINSLANVRTEVGYGPLAEDIALALSVFGGPIYYVIHNSVQVVLLTAQALTKLIGTGPTITVSGSPNDRYSLRVEVVTGGIIGTSTFKFSLDAWDATAAPFTYSQVRPTVASYVIPNTGLTLAMPAGTYVAGDVYTYSTVPQEPGTVDLATVAALLAATPALDFHLWSLSGSQPDYTTGAAVAAGMSSALTTLTQSYRYVRGLLDVGSGDTAANIIIGAGTWSSSRICPAYSYVLRQSQLPFEGYSTRKTSFVSDLAARAFSEIISSDLSRFAAGPMDGVSKIFFDGFYNQLVDAAGISTPRTWPGVPGFFITNAKLKSNFGSDYTDLQFGRVMDVACKTTYNAQLPFVSSEFRTVTDPVGAIDPRDAASIEAVVQDALNNALVLPLNSRGVPGLVSEVVYTVNLLNNLNTTGQLLTSVGIRPLGYAKLITTTLSLTLNP